MIDVFHRVAVFKDGLQEYEYVVIEKGMEDVPAKRQTVGSSSGAVCGQRSGQ